MSKVSEAPGRDPATLSPQELRDLRQEVAATRLQVRELNARLEENDKIGLEKKDLAARWSISKDQVAGIIIASGVKGRRIGRKKIWFKRDLDRLDAAAYRAGEEVAA